LCKIRKYLESLEVFLYFEIKIAGTAGLTIVVKEGK
jgi:hypothetical protein